MASPSPSVQIVHSVYNLITPSIEDVVNTLVNDITCSENIPDTPSSDISETSNDMPPPSFKIQAVGEIKIKKNPRYTPGVRMSPQRKKTKGSIQKQMRRGDKQILREYSINSVTPYGHAFPPSNYWRHTHIEYPYVKQPMGVRVSPNA